MNRNNLISKTYTVNGTVNLISDNIKNAKPVKVLHMKLLFYFEFDVISKEGDNVNDFGDESYQSSY